MRIKYPDGTVVRIPRHPVPRLSLWRSGTPRSVKVFGSISLPTLALVIVFIILVL
jgi:hypothetical protein